MRYSILFLFLILVTLLQCIFAMEKENKDDEIPTCYICKKQFPVMIFPSRSGCQHQICGLCANGMELSGKGKCPICKIPLAKYIFQFRPVGYKFDATKIDKAEMQLCLPLVCSLFNLKYIKFVFEQFDLDVNRHGFNGYIPLHCAKTEEIANYLLEEKHANLHELDAEDASALWRAVYLNNSDMVDYFLDKGMDIHQTNRMEETTLWIACKQGDVDSLKQCLEKGVDINKPDFKKRTPLYIASEEGHDDIVEILIQLEGIDIEKTDNTGVSPLFIASANGFFRIVKILVDAGANANNSQEKGGFNPLDVGAQSGNLEIVKYLVAKGKADVKHANRKGLTALHIAATIGHLNMVKYLVEAGADIHHPDTEAITALISAVLEGTGEVIQYLLQVGADVEHTRKFFSYAPRAAYRDLAKKLELFNNICKELNL